MNEQRSVYDVAIVGGGAAGLSAALVLARARRHVLVVDAGEPRNAPARHMHGYLSRDGLPPAMLLATGRREVERYGGEIVTDQVDAAVSLSPSRIGLTLRSGREVSARRLLVATGLRDELPAVPGLAERWARDVLHCPYCHGWEVQDKRLGVLGDGSPESVRYAQTVRQWSAQVTFFSPTSDLDDQDRAGLAGRGIEHVSQPVSRVVVERDHLTGVETVDGRVVPLDALFVPPRFVPHNELLLTLGCEVDAGGWATSDATGRTTVDGVWVAGNVANPRAQVITAAGEGSASAIAINADLIAEDVQQARQDPNESFPST